LQILYVDPHQNVTATLSEKCVESNIFQSYSAPVFQNLTPAPGMIPDYRKITDSCSCL